MTHKIRNRCIFSCTERQSQLPCLSVVAVNVVRCSWKMFDFQVNKKIDYYSCEMSEMP